MTVLTMVLPAYNEEAIIKANAVHVADELERVAQRLKVRIDLVVLDDGSTDATPEQVRQAQRLRPRIRYVYAPGPSRRENLAKVLLNADTEYVGWMDSDLATALDQVEELIMVARHHDIVTGSRYLASSRITRRPSRLLISTVYNELVRLMFRSRISDHWCGFKIFRREALAAIVAEIGVDVLERQMFWDAQMWVCAQRMGMSILEIPVTWREGEQSALRFSTELPMAAFTLRYWVSRKWRRIPDREGVPIHEHRPTPAGDLPAGLAEGDISALPAGRERGASGVPAR